MHIDVNATGNRLKVEKVREEALDLGLQLAINFTNISDRVD